MEDVKSMTFPTQTVCQMAIYSGDSLSQCVCVCVNSLTCFVLCINCKNKQADNGIASRSHTISYPAAYSFYFMVLSLSDGWDCAKLGPHLSKNAGNNIQLLHVLDKQFIDEHVPVYPRVSYKTMEQNAVYPAMTRMHSTRHRFLNGMKRLFIEP